jgi:arginase family enzyme
VTCLPPADLRGGRLKKELERLKSTLDAAYLHCDLDVLDPAEGRANQLPVADGLTVAEVGEMAQTIGRAVPVKAAAVTCYAPEYDTDGRVARAAFRIVDALIAAAGG